MDFIAAVVLGGLAGWAFCAWRRLESGLWIAVVVGIVGALFGATMLGPFAWFGLGMKTQPMLAGIGLLNMAVGALLAVAMLFRTQHTSSQPFPRQRAVAADAAA